MATPPPNYPWESEAPASDDSDDGTHDGDQPIDEASMHEGPVNNEIVPAGAANVTAPADEPSNDLDNDGSGSSSGSGSGSGSDSSSSDHDDDDTGSEDSQSEVDFKGNCGKTCEPPFQNRRVVAFRRKQKIRLLKRQMERFRASGVTLRRRLRAMEQAYEALKKKVPGGKRKTKTTWQRELAKLLSRERDAKAYETIYNISYKEENYSKLLHPLLRLRPPTSKERVREIGIAPNHENALGAPAENHAAEIVSERQFPPHILVEILKHVLVFPGQPIHVMSRLDPYNSPDHSHVLDPDAFLDKQGTSIRLLHRFLIGNGPFSLTLAPKPNELLAPLLVSRQWHYFACNIFYSLNKFCFSSLGELGRFGKGIGARAQRIQDIELFWVGHQSVTYKIAARGKFISRRTHPLYWLLNFIRLKKIGIHVRESDKFYRRRKHEPRGAVQFMNGHTATHPNYRLNRSLNNLQGLDNLRAVRGTHSVHFYDYDMFLKHGKSYHCVRDIDFVRHMNEVTGRAKEPNDLWISQFANLSPLEISFIPEREEMQAVRRAVRMERETDDSRLGTQPGHQHWLPGPVFFGGGDESTDGDDDDDESAYQRAVHGQIHGANAAATEYAVASRPPSFDVGDDDGDDMAMAASEGGYYDPDEEMHDASNHGPDDADDEDNEDSDDSDDEGGAGGVPVSNRRSSSLFVPTGSHERNLTPQQQRSPSQRAPTEVDFAERMDSYAEKLETPESDLFVVSDTEAEDEDGGAPLETVRSDSEDGADESDSESSSESFDSSDEEKKTKDDLVGTAAC